MTREEVVRLAIESGVADRDLSREGQAVTDYGDATDALERFAALVAAAEREACAKVCLEPEMEFFMPRHTTTGAPYKARPKTGGECAAAIRARGQKGGAV